MPAATVDLLLQILVYKQCKEAGEEVCPDAVVPPYIDRSCIEVGLHDAEAVLDDPAAAVQPDDCRGRILKIRTQGIKAVEAGFLVNHLLIEGIAFHLGKLPVCGAVLGLDEAFCVIRALARGCRSPAFCQQGERAVYLTLTHIGEILPVLEGECDDDALLQRLSRGHPRRVPALLVEKGLVMLHRVKGTDIILLFLISSSVKLPVLDVHAVAETEAPKSETQARLRLYGGGVNGGHIAEALVWSEYVGYLPQIYKVSSIYYYKKFIKFVL